MEWLSEFWVSLTPGKVAIIVAILVASFLLSLAVVAIILVNIPRDYFRSDNGHLFFAGYHPVFRIIAIVAKNLLGVCLIIAGIFLSLPGVPGQGILTILIGLILTDIPGKKALEAHIIRRPSILSAVNKLRARYKRPPLELE